MFANPWHSVSYGDVEAGSIYGIIEIPKNSRAKYELEKESGMLIMDRVLYSSINYPANYGFIPQTYCDDGDPLDILVFSQIAITPMCIVQANVIGVMRMLDNDEADDKIIAVATNDMSVNHVHDISQLPDHLIRELRSFFEDYKKLENKEVVVEEFQNRQVAIEVLAQSVRDYDAKFRNPA